MRDDLPDQADPETLPQEGPGVERERSWQNRILDGVVNTARGMWLFLGRWAWPVIVIVIFLILSLISIWKVGWRPVVVTLLLSIPISWAILKSIKVYYTHVIQADLEDGHTLRLRFFDVPVEISHLIRIEGAKGYVKDAWGRDLILVSAFDPFTLTGIGTWEDNLTPLHFATRWSLAEQTVKTYARVIRRYGQESVRARLDCVADQIEVATFAQTQLGLSDRDLDQMLNEVLGLGPDNRR